MDCDNEKNPCKYIKSDISISVIKVAMESAVCQRKHIFGLFQKPSKLYSVQT